MSQSKNWKAYYSGDFTHYDLTIEGEVQSHKTLTVEPGLREADSPSINPAIFNVQLMNAGDGVFKKVKQVFTVPNADVTTVLILNEEGKEEASVAVTAKGNGNFSSEFSNDFG